MERIAFLSGEFVIYSSHIVVVLGALTAIFAFLALYLHSSGNWTGAMLLVPLCTLLGVLGARLLHWYGYPAAYESWKDALIYYQSGGFALPGAVAGCLLAAVHLRQSRRIPNLPQALDCMALAGLAGISVGRLSALFNASDRGPLTDGSLGFPWESGYSDIVTGETEYRFATFLFQSAGCACICLGVLIWYLASRKRSGFRHGDVGLLAMLLYCALEVLLDSTRYDSLFLRSNGFVSLVQILCVPGLLAAPVVFSVRLLRKGGWRFWYPLLWLGCLASLGGAGYMEYFVQRHGNQAVTAYSIMGSCLVVFTVLAAVLYELQVRKKTTQTSLCE